MSSSGTTAGTGGTATCGDAPVVAVSGSTLTIRGVGFGTKPVAAPLYHDDYEGYAPGESALDVGLDDLGTDGNGLPLLQEDRSFSGSKSLRMDYTAEHEAMFPRVGKNLVPETRPGHDELYTSMRMYWERTSGTGSPSPIFKLCRGGANPPYSGVPRFYETIFAEPSGKVIASDRGFVNELGEPTYLQDVTAGQDAGAWHFVEYYYKLSSPGGADGAFQQWVDLTANVDAVGITTRGTGSDATIQYVMSVFDGFDSYTGSYRVWLDDWYVDTTRQRVEIGDASPYESCTRRVPQPPITWSDCEITAAYDGSGLSQGTRYVYVIGADGKPVDPTGLPVVLP